MRNLLGRLHARRQQDLLRIADAWGVPLHDESKGEVVATLYRAMTDPRTVRDVWDRLTVAERAVAVTLADAPDAAPTVGELASRLGVPAEEARETALGLYRAGILAREGDDEPLPIGMAPRLLLPREVALNIRRIQDEMAAGALDQSPLRVLIELLDDSELEAAARTWGMRALAGVTQRRELTSRLLRLVNDGNRVQRVIQGLGRDAAAIWKIARTTAEPVSLSDAAVRAGLGALNKATAARLRASLTELEGALLVWHAYRSDGTRWLFVPREIRNPGQAPPALLPPIAEVRLEEDGAERWHHPDALAWDLSTLLRILSGPQTPPWNAAEPPPRWLFRAAAQRFWFGERDGAPAGYLELLRALGLAEGILAVDEEARQPHLVLGPQARAWRGMAFPEQTARLRERWLRLSRWIEGEPAGIVDIWGAEWRGMRPRLLAALVDPEIGLAPESWATLESATARIAARYPALLGPSFTAATARLGGEAGAGADEDEARAAALGDVIAFELAGPFTWFGLTWILDRAGQPRAVCVTGIGAALAAGKPLTSDNVANAARAPLLVDPAGEITLQTPSPDRVWALSAFAEPVDLGPASHYRLTPGSIGMALTAGIEREQIVAFLERGSRQPLPPALAANLTHWARGVRRVGLRHAVVLAFDDPSECAPLLEKLRAGGWNAEPHGNQTLLVYLGQGDGAAHDEENLEAALRTAGHAPHWASETDEGQVLGGAPIAAAEQAPVPGDG